MSVLEECPICTTEMCERYYTSSCCDQSVCDRCSCLIDSSKCPYCRCEYPEWIPNENILRNPIRPQPRPIQTRPTPYQRPAPIIHHRQYRSHSHWSFPFNRHHRDFAYQQFIERCPSQRGDDEPILNDLLQMQNIRRGSIEETIDQHIYDLGIPSGYLGVSFQELMVNAIIRDEERYNILLTMVASLLKMRRRENPE